MSTRTHRTCRECGETLPRDQFEGKRLQCRQCRAMVRNKDCKQRRDTMREPKPWPLVRRAYGLSEQDEQVIAMAAQHYGRREPSADDVISAYVRDHRRQCELLTALAYRLAANSVMERDRNG